MSYHEDVADDDGGCAGLGEEGDEGPQAQAAERVEGVPAVRVATKFPAFSFAKCEKVRSDMRFRGDNILSANYCENCISHKQV
jgi:hypothetical protein